VGDGFRLFAKHPLPFSLMFVVFMAAAVLSSAVPLVGGFVLLCAVPALGLGFMVASESALKGGPIHPGQYIVPFRTDARRRRDQITLCLSFGLATLLIMAIADFFDGGSFARLQNLMAEEAPQPEIDAVMMDPQFQTGVLVRFGLAALLSLPFWHAPALVHWGQQSAAQALFSSTLAIWRNKGAFAAYFLAWLGVIVLFGVFVTLVFGLLGARQMVAAAAIPAALIFSTVFYTSLIFSFNDSFRGSQPAVPQEGPAGEA
jgi:hypothetical protein